MTQEDVGTPQELMHHWDNTDRRKLFAWTAFGLGVLTAMVGVTVAGLYGAYQVAIGDIFQSLVPVSWATKICGPMSGATIAAGVTAVILVLWLVMIMRVLFTGVDPSDGIAVSAEDAPDFFALIDRVSSGRSAAALDRVVIDMDCNACLECSPTIGMLGSMKTSLVIGLPLLDAIDVRDLPVLLGHELAHLSDHEDTLKRTAVRTEAIWTRVHLCCTEGWPPAAGLITRFASWYLDRLNALLLRHFRHGELAADASAASGHGTDASASVILRVAVASLWFERMWELFPTRFRRHSEPQFRPFHVAPRWFRRLNDPDRFERLLRVAMVQASSHRDTHPAWHERVAALGSDVPVPPPVQLPASSILGVFGEKLRNDLNSEWQELASEYWSDSHEHARESEEQLAALEREAATGKIEPEDVRALAYLTRDLRGAKQAVALFESIVDSNPEDAEMRFCLGEALLELHEDKGLLHLDRARELDPGLSTSVIALASDYLASRGDMALARSYSTSIDGALDELERAENERLNLSRRDVLEPHGLDRASVAEIRDRVCSVPGVRRAWLARKYVERLKARPCLVLVIEYTPLKTVLGTAETAHDRIMEVCANLHYDMFIIRRTMATGHVLQKIMAVPGSVLLDPALEQSIVAREVA